MTVTEKSIRLEVISTYACNARCDHCDRAVGYAEFDNTALTQEQMARAVDQCNQQQVKVDRVSISGGEPVMNKGLQGIVTEARRLEVRSGRRFIGRVLTNGMPRSKPLRDKIQMPKGFNWFENPLDEPDDPKSGKNDPTKRFRVHYPFFISPADIGIEAKWEWCGVRGWCGKGFDSSGWMMCGKAGMLGRLFQIDPHLRGDGDIFEHVNTPINDICRHCQYGMQKKNAQQTIYEAYQRGELEAISPTFKKVLQRHAETPTTFERY